MNRRLVPSAACILAPAALSAQQPAQPADLIVTAARVYTADGARPQAQAVAVRGGRFVFVGSTREAMTLRGPTTRVLELPGRTIIPGMTDAHAHLLGLGMALRNVDLVGTRAYGEVVARVAARARETRTGEWIRGRGWNQNDWPDTRFPTHETLSRAVPDHPVVLTRVDGHASLVNAMALSLAGITSRTPDPPGGRIIRDARGEPTGVLVDAAQGLVNRVVPPPSDEEIRSAAAAAIREANRWGLTAIHDAGVNTRTIAVYERMAAEGPYPLRHYIMIRDDSAALNRFFARDPQLGLHGGRLWIRAVKLSADGALGSRGAALLEDYSDEPGNRGLATTPAAYVLDVARRSLRGGFQLCVHAIGDAANRSVLDAFETALRENPVADHRFRVEHAQVLHRQDVTRFAELGVIPSMQASHQTSDMHWAMNRLGWTRIQGAYAWRSLLNTGVVVPNGSDFPVEAVNPLISFHAAVTRQDANGWPAGGWFPAERMTREEALLSMTIWPAYAAFMERESGSITPGKYADFVVLDQDIMTAAPERILDTQVVMTVWNGEVAYRRSEQ
jgi:hypothetical protein